LVLKKQNIQTIIPNKSMAASAAKIFIFCGSAPAVAAVKNLAFLRATKN